MSKVPCIIANAGHGLTAAICVPASKISEMVFPEGKWKGEYEVECFKGLTNIPVARL